MSWSKEHADLLSAHYGRLPVAEIAAMVGRTADAVMSRAKRLGLGKRVSRRHWHPVKGSREGLFYAFANIGGNRVLMHRFLCDAGPGETVRHGDGDGLNNRRSNLDHRPARDMN